MAKKIFLFDFDGTIVTGMLSLAGHKFGIDPKGDFKKCVDIVIEDDISKVIKYL